MSPRLIMDAGPGLNFFSLNKERLLFGTVGAISIPSTVREEILRKSQHDYRFEAAERVLKKLPERLMNVLCDETTKELEVVCQRLTGLDLMQRQATSKNLGELMVICHAVVKAEAGSNVTILIDDGDGRKMATQEANRLKRLRVNHQRLVGTISLVSTTTVLRTAAENGHFKNVGELKTLYKRMRELDDGLLPFEDTNLARLACWKKGK